MQLSFRFKYVIMLLLGFTLAILPAVLLQKKNETLFMNITDQRADFPNVYHEQSRILSLPIFPEMTEAHIDALAAAICSFDGAFA